jgi:hypothetical protein
MPALKTYSKRVKYHKEEPPSKKRRAEEPLPVALSPRVKKPEGSTIQSYFRPLQRSSSPSTTRVPHRASAALEHISSPRYQLPSDSLEHTSPSRTRSSQLSSDTLEPTSTPPSSPPPRVEPSVEHARKSQKRRKRRLKSRPVLTPILNMSTQGASGHGSDDGTEFNDVLGGVISSGISPPWTAKIEGQDQHTANPLPRAKPHSTISSLSTQGASDHNSDGATKHNDHPDGVTASSIGPVDSASIMGQDEHATNPRFRTTSHSSVAGSSIQKLHQTQLDMGAPAIKACKGCGMHYNTTLDGDRRNHTKYHNGIVQAKQLQSDPYGVDLEVDYIGADRHTIREYDYRIQDIHKDRAYKALQLASHDLGGIIPTADELWSLIANPQNKNDQNQVPRFKLYLYLINMDPVGLLLAERIAGGGDYYFGVFPSPSNKTVYMCVERIWVREDMRRKRVASRLVDKARTCFIRGLYCRKLEYAFSRPTELGRKFADSYVKSLPL